MADDVLSWEFRLIDSVSAGADKVDKSVKKAAGGMAKWINVFHDLEDIGHRVFSQLEKAAELGSMVLEARKWKEETMIGLRAITGSAKAADDVFKMAETLAIQTGQSTREVVDAAKRLVTAGYTLGDTKVLETVLSDVKILDGAAAMDTVADALAKMGTSGHVTERTMLALNTVAGLGGKVTDILGKKLHVTQKELKELITAGKVPKDWGAYAIAEGVRQLGGGKLGTVTHEISETFSGLVGSIKDEFMSLFTQGEGGLGDGIRKPLETIKEILMPGSPFITGVKDGIGELLKGFGSLGDGGGLDSFLKGLKDGSALGDSFRETMRSIGEDARGLFETLRALGTVIGYVGKGFSAVGKGIGWAASEVADIVSGEKGHQNTMALGSAVGVPGVTGKGVPALAAGGIVRGPTLALIGEKGPEAVVPLGSGGGGHRGGIQGGIHINVSVAHHGGGGGGSAGASPDSDPSALADTVADVILERLNSALEDLAVEGGIG